MIVVVPTAREVSLAHLRPLLDAGARIIVVDDSDGRVDIRHPQVAVYNWSDQDRMLGANARAIPRRNGACRDFGFFVAWREGSPGEAIVALDDDCAVEEADFAAQVEQVLGERRLPVARGAGTHFNILDCYEGIEPNVFPRGFPYSARADHAPWTFADSISGRVAFNLGLWKGIFDVNAIDKLQGPRYEYPDARLRHGSVAVPSGALASLCSMNMQFRRELIPAVYQMLMHVEVMPGWVVDRYGDIWGGFILKTLMDARGDLLSVGAPMIRHLKAGSYTRNIWQEHTCHLLNDEFIDLLLDVRGELRASDYLTMMAQLTDGLARRREKCSMLLGRYLDVQLPALASWVRLLS